MRKLKLRVQVSNAGICTQKNLPQFLNEKTEHTFRQPDEKVKSIKDLF